MLRARLPAASDGAVPGASGLMAIAMAAAQAAAAADAERSAPRDGPGPVRWSAERHQRDPEVVPIPRAMFTRPPSTAAELTAPLRMISALLAGTNTPRPRPATPRARQFRLSILP